MGRHRRPTRWDASAAPITRNPRRELRTGTLTTPTGERMLTLGADPARPRIGNPLLQDMTKRTITPGASRICPRTRQHSIQGTDEIQLTHSRTRRKNPRRRSTTSSPEPAPRGYADCSSLAKPQGKRPAGPPPCRDTDRTMENPTGGRTRTSPPGARGKRSWTPRPPPDETTGLSCGTTRTTRTYRTAPNSPTRAWRGPSRRHRAAPTPPTTAGCRTVPNSLLLDSRRKHANHRRTRAACPTALNSPTRTPSPLPGGSENAGGGNPNGGVTRRPFPPILPHPAVRIPDRRHRSRLLIQLISGTRQRTRRSPPARTRKVRLKMTKPLTIYLF